MSARKIGARGSRVIGALVLVVVGTWQAGCAGESDPEAANGGEQPPLVMAAASLNLAMPELIEQFRERTGVDITLVTGATGNLAAQIQNGAPADLFFAADDVTVARLEGEGLIRPGSERTYAEGRIVVVARDGLPTPSSLEALAADPYEVIAIANPEVAPYGAAAREALRGAGIWEAIEPSVVLGTNVAATYQFALTGNADAAIVALSVIDPDSTEFLPIDVSTHAPLTQSAGIVAASTNASATRFLDFTLSDEGREILGRYGFAPPRAGG